MRPTDAANVAWTARASMWGDEHWQQRQMIRDRWGKRPPLAELERIKAEHEAIAKDYQRPA